MNQMRSFGLTFFYEKMFDGPSVEHKIRAVRGWVECTEEEEKILNGIPTEFFTRYGKDIYSNSAFGVSEPTYSDYLASMVTAIRDGFMDGLESDGTSGIDA